jgi:X-Pro dipeptidyl-peptidase
MKRRWSGGFAAAVLVVLAGLVTSAPALAQQNPGAVVEDGVSQPVYGYANAIRERLWVTADFDSDLDGVADEIAMDIIRPAATATGHKAPLIMDASPYYTTVCRGNESECIADVDGDGINDRWPLFYDNYFVPRGYAVMLLHMAGTGFSTGCPHTGGIPDNLSAVAAIDWLQGRKVARNAAGEPVDAGWHSGKAGMIGKSYDGTLANAAAVTGVEGLTTIVPISAISSWYDYTRSNGITTRTSYLGSLANTVTNPARRAYCSPIRTLLNNSVSDTTGDYNDAWRERDYNPDVDKVKASVFAIHGLQDDNVRTDHFSKWWYGLTEQNVPRKVWLNGSGHIDPFDFRRAHWVHTIHRWFDHWLYGIPNGIMDEPTADVEVAASVFESYDDWPIPGTEKVNVYLQSATGAGVLGLAPTGGDPIPRTFTNSTTQTETTAMNNPTTVTANRLVYLTQPLTAPVRISGTPVIKLKASANATAAYFGAILVDYGNKVRITRTGDGISTLGASSETCWGESSPNDDPCYRETVTNTTNPSQWRVSKGILDGRNRNSYSTAEAMVPGQQYDITFPLLPNDYVFPAGNRIGVIIIGSYTSYSAQTLSGSWQVTLDGKLSSIELPIVGGFAAAAAAGFAPDVTAPEITVPDDIVVTAVSPETTVEYEASAVDDADPNPSLDCEPASGSVFPYDETTTVTCTSADWAGNTSQATFTVTVKGPVIQLAELKAALFRQGPGTSLQDKITVAEGYLAAGDLEGACGMLLRGFPGELRAQLGKRLTAAEAEAFTADAARIAAVLDC